MGLEIDREDVEELVQDHSTELTTEELVYIQNEQEQSFKDEEKTEQSIPSASIKEICSKWNNVQAFVKKYQCDIVVANRTVNLFNVNVISHFRKILQTRQKQQTLDKFLIKKKKKRKETQEKDLPKSKRQRIEETTSELPEVFIEEDYPSKK